MTKPRQTNIDFEWDTVEDLHHLFPHRERECAFGELDVYAKFRHNGNEYQKLPEVKRAAAWEFSGVGTPSANVSNAVGDAQLCYFKNADKVTALATDEERSPRVQPLRDVPHGAAFVFVTQPKKLCYRIQPEIAEVLTDAACLFPVLSLTNNEVLRSCNPDGECIIVDLWCAAED